MKGKLSLSLAISLALLASLFFVFSAAANPPAPGDQPVIGPATDVIIGKGATQSAKPIDQPNPADYWRNQQRQRLLEAGQVAEANALALTGSDRVLVILVEFAGTDTFTWTADQSKWDPYGMVDPAQAVLKADGTVDVGNCSKIITETKTFTYTGPLHNQIPRPLNATDRSGQSIWTEDFSNGWFHAFMFGNGVKFQYTRQDGSVVNEDFTGKSVNQYFQDMSGGLYSISGDVIGWLQLPHSTWWYGADQCPGRRSVAAGSDPTIASAGAIPGAGNNGSLVRDALNAVNAMSNTIPGFDWKNYDLNGDGIIDRLWIVHAGYGEEDGTDLLNRTNYGEAANWSHSSQITNYPVAPGVAAGPYIMMPENGGIGVFAHESAHNLGADDLYAYDLGNTSTGFWALQADDWTGYPIGFEPPAVDPWHLDNWGWLNPAIVNDPTKEYVVTVGQASAFPGGAGVVRGVKIPLPAGAAPLPIAVWQGQNYWWGGKADLANGMMTTKNPVAIPAGAAASLSFDLEYDIEPEWDFLWIQASEDGTTWKTLTNAATICTHDPAWIGEINGFPADLCAAGIGGFSGHNTKPEQQIFDLSAYAGKSIWLRFWYMTDWGSTGAGAFIDVVQVKSGDTVLFADDAEAGDAKWTYAAPWVRSNGAQPYTHNYYLQWRNVSKTGGYDESLSDPRWRFGPANTGLLVWYNNNFYNDNEIYSYLQDFPSFGPKGRMLVVEANSEPYRDVALVGDYPNAISNLTSRGQMRDATFSQNKSVDFIYPAVTGVPYVGKPAVSAFHDAFGYYPGVENARRGKLPCTTLQWYDKMWDASATVPATGFYSTKATGPAGFTSNTGLRMRGFANPAGLCGASWYGFWYTPWSTPMNTGNPGDEAKQYGWHVQILAQTEQTATLKIWNAMQEANMALTPDKATAKVGDKVQYTFAIQNVGSPLNLFACAPLDPFIVGYVPGSASPGVVPLPMDCPAMAAALAANPQALSQMATAEAMDVKAIGFTAWAPTGSMGAGSFQVEVKPGAAVPGKISQEIRLFDNGAAWRTVAALDVAIEPITAMTETLKPTADSFIASGLPTTNYGAWAFAYVGAGDSNRGLLKFDVSGINTTYPVDQAILAVYVDSFSGGGSAAELRAYEVTESWAESTVTWNAPWSVSGGKYVEPAAGAVSIDNTAVGKWVKIDITSLVQKWVANPAMNQGAILHLRNATSYTTYRLATKEHWIAANAPKLDVTYRKP